MTTLKNQILSGRIGHAYLFCGTRGTGKTSVAKLFAKAVNCEHPNGADPCNECGSCIAASKQAASNIMEIDAASNNSVDDIRGIRAEVEYRPAQGKYKVYIIDEAHMLSAGAFNALLKTLEEPPEYVIFILATTEAAKLPVTIVSRCQRFDFRRISIDTIASRLEELTAKEGISVEEKGLRYISRLADGSLRDALSLLERCVSGMGDGNLTYDEILSVLGTVDSGGYHEMLGLIMQKDIKGAIKRLERFSLEGRDMSSFASGFTWYLRNLLLAGNAEGIEDVLDVTKEEFVRLQEQAEMIPDGDLMRYIRVFSELSSSLRNSVSKRIDVEMAIIRLCRPQMENDPEALTSRIRELEDKVSGFEHGAFVPVTVPEKRAADQEKQEEAQPFVPRKAAPEMLGRIKEKWSAIISDLPSGKLVSVLSGSEVCYNSAEQDNILYVKVKDSFYKELLEEENGSKPLSEAVEKAAGGTVVIKFQCDKDPNRDPHVIPVPSLESIQKKIKGKIDIID